MAALPSNAAEDEVSKCARAWLRWQALAVVSPGDPAMQGAFDAYSAGLARLAPDASDETLAGQAERLVALHRYGLAQTVDAARAQRLAEGEPTLEKVQALQNLIERWLRLDDAFALRLFGKQLEVVTALPPDVGLPLMAALIQPHATNGRELLPHVEGRYRPAVAGHARLAGLAELVSVPSAGLIAVRAVAALPRDTAVSQLTAFLTMWGDSQRRSIIQDPRMSVDEKLKAMDQVMSETLMVRGVTTPVRAGRVSLLARAGRVDDALAAAAEFESKEPQESPWRGLVGLDLGEVLVRRGRYREAVVAYQGVVVGSSDPGTVALARDALAELKRMGWE